MPDALSLEALADPIILYPLAALLCGVAFGAFLVLMLRHRAAEAQGSAVDQSRDHRKTVALLQNENRSLSTFLMNMPDLARQLNSNVEKRRIPQILIAFIEQLFEVEQVLIFLTTKDGKCLTLAGGKGVPDNARGHEVVMFGHGRIGCVAETQITMDEGDFKARVKEPSAPSLIRTELAAPLVSKERTLGVISLGGLLRRPKNEKNMLKMVADLGSISIQNTILFSEIQQSANMDGLTKLANKRHFTERLADEILKAEKERRSLSLFLFDIDHFKTYNDRNGHLAGDEALRITGQLMKQMVRSDDLPARYGGEEFAVILPNTDKQGALRLAEKLRRAVEAYEYPNEKTQPLGKVTMSGGVATVPDDGKSSAEIIRCADQALYQCKHAGRNRVQAFETRNIFEESSAANKVGHQAGGQ
ncbi:MAG: diguanylate cyclase [Candidatus Polarisedimenticolia bacterium]